MADRYPEPGEETQWRVIWFPGDGPDRIVSGPEQTIRAKARQEAEWNPIIEKRSVIVGPWEADNG